MSDKNPFQNRHKITNQQEFFGREDEYANIISRLGNTQSCSIVGERRIGKSSFLWHICQTGAGQLGESYKFFYHDLQSAKYHTLAGFCRKVLEEAGLYNGWIEEDNSANKNLVAFTDQINERTQKGDEMIFCFDEFEILFKHKNEFNDDFFDHLRSEINADNFSLVTASKNNLQHLCLEGKLTSPFYNVFLVTELNEFKPAEAGEFLEFFYTKDFLTDEDLIFVCNAAEIHKWHPLKLQIVCDCLFQNRKSKLSEDELVEKIKKEFGNYFVETFDFKNWRKAKKIFSLEYIKQIFDTLKSGREIIKGKSDD